MSVNFRCNNCGNLLTAQGKGQAVHCPHCDKDSTVPTVVESMPQPHLPPDNPAAKSHRSAAPRASAPSSASKTVTAGSAAAQAAPALAGHADQGDAVVGVMARVTPWVISVMFHVGVAMILAFASIIAAKTAAVSPDDGPIVPDAVFSDNPGGSLNSSNAPAVNNNASSVERKEYAKREAVEDAGHTTKKVPITVAGAGGGVGASSGTGGLGLSRGGGGASGPRSNLFGQGGNAHHVVYVIDRSGSMNTSFDFLRAEMLKSISKLRPIQDFHVIFFSSGAPQENPPKQLVPATDEYKTQAAEFLTTIQPENQTDPTAALRRAFEVLDKADPTKRGKLLYLLTDGVFQDNEKVLALLRDKNVKKDVFIHTFLYDSKDKAATEVMKSIAKENGGTFKSIDLDE